jgi:predicted nucleic acid-binding protein
LEEEIAAQEALFPNQTALAFDAYIAVIAARLYQTVRRPRGRELDLAIAATALAFEAELWTLNRSDFSDIPHLRLIRPAIK